MLSLALLLGALALVDRLVLARSALPPRARLLHALAILSLSLAAMALAPAGPALGKCLGRLAMPLGLLWLLSLVAATITTRRATIRAAAGLWAVAGLIASIANPYLGAAALHSLEAPYDAQRPLEEEPFEAVIVLGGGVAIDVHGDAHLGESGDRVLLGARLYLAGRTPLLLTSGRSVPGLGEPFDASEATARIWTELGIPAQAIVRLPEPYNTRMEAAQAAALVRERGWERVGLLTSAFHMRRAMALFEAQGLRPIPLPADRRGPARFDGTLSLLPSASGLAALERASWERLGALLGR